MVAAVRDQDAVLQEHERLGRDAVDRARRGDQDVRIRERLLERADAVAVHVRLERRDRVDLDHGHAPAGATGRPREPFPDPAVADDAELAAGEGQVREPVDRRERRLAGAVAVVEQVLAERVVGRDRRERELSGRLHRAQPRDAGRRLLGHAREPCRDLGPVLDDPRRQLGAVVDDDLRLRVGDGEQVGVELVARGAVARVHLDPARDERGADRVLRRARVRAGGDDLRAGVGEQRRQVRRLRLEMDDDRDATARAAPRRRAARARAGSGRASAWPPTRIRCSPCRCERRVGDLGAGGGVHGRNLSGGCEYPRAHPCRAVARG